MTTHEFGIIDEVSENTYDTYEPNKYRCISIDDEIIENLLEPLAIMQTFWHSLNRPALGLAYCGITIIPPKSFPLFLEVLALADFDTVELREKILQAKNENKYMIHFGI